MLSLATCQNNHQEVDTSWNRNLSQKISLEELPVTIKEEIHNDELFQGLDISDITKITKNNFTYYDMTFRDADGQIIMVFYDENGQIVVP